MRTLTQSTSFRPFKVIEHKKMRHFFNNGFKTRFGFFLWNQIERDSRREKEYVFYFVTEYLKSFSQILLHLFFLKTYCFNNKKAQVLLLSGLETLACETLRTSCDFKTVLKILLRNDIVTKQSIQYWLSNRPLLCFKNEKVFFEIRKIGFEILI